MEAHPLADLFPMMDRRELEALAADIKDNGLREPIAIDAEGRIVDGRNRWAACEIAGVDPTTVTTNGDPSGLIVSANIMRRHMTKTQIAILAVIAETGVTLPAEDDRADQEVDLPSRSDKNYDYQRQAHRRVERLVSPALIDTAARIVQWAPEHARMILDSGQGMREADAVARARSKLAHSEENRRAILADQNPELLALVGDSFTIDEAWGTREKRMRQERETRVRLTGYLVDRITPLLGKSDPAELIEHYDPDVAGRKIGIAELDEAITYIKTIRREMVQHKKG